MANELVDPFHLNVLSLNCWGLRFIAKVRRERLNEIGVRIAAKSPPPHIVGLQECWTQEDYLAIREHTQHILPYGKFYHGGIFGAGLAILSKWPIEESSMIQYPMNGRPTAFFRGDWFVGKGVAYARIRYGPGIADVIEAFCTHMHAPYEREPNDSYICHRTAQAWEFAKLIRGAIERGHLALGMGDFNMLPLSFAHELITKHAPVHDVWRVLHPDSSIGASVDSAEKARGRPVPTVEQNMLENGATCDSAHNTWRWNKGQQQRLSKGERIPVPPDTPDPNARRLDYIFVGAPSPSRQDVNSTLLPPMTKTAWFVDDVRVGMTEPHPSLGCSLSDHFSIEASLSRRFGVEVPESLHTISSPSSEKAFHNYYPHSYQTISTSSRPDFICSRPHPPSTSQPLSSLPISNRLPIQTYTSILGLVSHYNARERFQRHFRLTHFGVQLLISIGCLVAVWWVPHNYVAFILMLMSTLGLAAGVLDGLIGGLFVGSELRALKEFEWEVRNAQKLALESKSQSMESNVGRAAPATEAQQELQHQSFLNALSFLDQLHQTRNGAEVQEEDRYHYTEYDAGVPNEKDIEEGATAAAPAAPEEPPAPIAGVGTGIEMERLGR
ncbi:DNase I-like protein [Xylona heveae TC161]|uniref:DNase I-like protein n=1 Tax=Xylona heveae (strain CBS 132557 / TC161) TaxID=1328760 RepID=A0A165GN52_XYLHT|nr:DNase I-like protein [Xylona heveae TC161]KZF22392.1 DNase I-like protein [Xylona heveae TC161]